MLSRPLVFAAAVVLSGVVTAQDASPGSQWLSYNNRLDGQRYSPLKEITPENVAQLGEVCRVQVDGPTSFHAGMVVTDGTLYTSTGRYTLAIDATTCAVRWKHTYLPDEERSGPSNRGVAVMDGRVFRGTGDARLLALDAATGKVLWKNVLGTGALGESAPMVPLAWQGVVYMGIAGSEFGVRGRVMAFDAATGKELWRFNTIPMGKETGAETWLKPETAKTGGGGVWGAMSVDPSTGELLVPVGNAWPDVDKAYRPGKNLFTTSVVVLDARTGALKWWHQTAPEDWQDLDIVAAPVVYRVGNAKDILAFGGKDGYVTGLDRDTHKVLFRTPVTTIVQAPPVPTKEGTKSCPGYAGGVEWNGPALDRMNNQLIVGAVDVCFLVVAEGRHAVERYPQDTPRQRQFSQPGRCRSAPALDRPARRDLAASHGHQLVGEVHGQADVVRHDPHLLAELEPVARLDVAVLLVQPHEARGRRPQDEAETVVGRLGAERLAARVDDRAAAAPTHDRGGHGQRDLVERGGPDAHGVAVVEHVRAGAVLGD